MNNVRRVPIMGSMMLFPLVTRTPHCHSRRLPTTARQTCCKAFTRNKRDNSPTCRLHQLYVIQADVSIPDVDVLEVNPVNNRKVTNRALVAG